MVPLELLAVPLQSSDTASVISGSVVLLFQLLLGVVQVAGVWKIFTKAGHAGWKAIIPIYNFYIMLQIGENQWWCLLLLVIPFLNLYAVYKIHSGVARAFGRGIGFGLGLTFLGILFYPLVGFGDYQYQQSSGLAQLMQNSMLATAWHSPLKHPVERADSTECRTTELLTLSGPRQAGESQ